MDVKFTTNLVTWFEGSVGDLSFRAVMSKQDSKRGYNGGRITYLKVYSQYGDLYEFASGKQYKATKIGLIAVEHLYLKLEELQ